MSHDSWRPVLLRAHRTGGDATGIKKSVNPAPRLLIQQGEPDPVTDHRTKLDQPSTIELRIHRHATRSPIPIRDDQLRPAEVVNELSIIGGLISVGKQIHHPLRAYR